MRRLTIGNALLVVTLTLIILISSIHPGSFLFSSPVVNASSSSYLMVSNYPTSVTAGQSFSGLMVTAYNSKGEIDTNYHGSVYFTSSDPIATLPFTLQTSYRFNPGHDKGVHSFSGFNLVTAGLQTITATDGSMSASTHSVNVNSGSPIKIQISPKTTSVTAGGHQTYTCTATDYYGNSWDVTSQTSWSITAGAVGLWSKNIYTSSQVGTWTVIGSYSSLQDSAFLTVNHAGATSFSISPKTATIVAGAAEAYTALAIDSFGNSWDVSNSAKWSIDTNAGGEWTNNIYYSIKAGAWAITATMGSLSDTAILTVNHVNAVSINISPKTATMSASSRQRYSALASDLYGNTWDVTTSIIWTASFGAQGSWSTNAFTSSRAGTWTITGTLGSLTDTTSLTVNHGNIANLGITPNQDSLQAGSIENYKAVASDSYGNTWDVTDSAKWSIVTNAGGSWSNNIYTSAASGQWTVTGSFSGFFATAYLTITHASPTKIIVASSLPSTTAGTTVTYTAIGVDGFGNSWDVTDLVTWSLSSGADGSWNANTYTTAKSGSWTVTGNLGGLTNSAFLTVTNNSPVSITVFPQTSILTAGSTQLFQAKASDKFGNTWDVTTSTIWSISSGAQGSWSDNSYTSAKSGDWTMNGKFGTLFSSAPITVSHGSAVHISTSPKTATITAGVIQTFTTTAFDSFGNQWDSTSSASFGVDQMAGGSLNGNQYSGAIAGTWTVTASSLGLSDTAALTVTHTESSFIRVNPSTNSITAGDGQLYKAIAYDIYYNSWDVSDLTTWTATEGAGGSWIHNQYISSAAGNWQIYASYLGLSDSVFLTVNHAAPVSLTVSPKTAGITAGSNEVFSATAADTYGNTWDVSKSSNWQVTLGAGGSWTSNVYTSKNAGGWIVTANVDSLLDTCSLTVNHGSPLSISIRSSSSSITAGSNQAFTAIATDSNGNSWDVTGSTAWSIEKAAGGSWIGSSYVSSVAGDWIVTGTYSGLSSASSLTVNHGDPVNIAIGLSSSSAVAGSPITFFATVSDVYGNTWDVTSSSLWTIDSGALGTWSGNTYNSAIAGLWTVTCSSGTLSKSVYVTINHGQPKSMSLNPFNAQINAGSKETFTALAIDEFGNSWDVTGSVSLGISSAAGGSWSSNVYTSEKAGEWIVSASLENILASSPLNINHGSATQILISPKMQEMEANSKQTFVATAYDSYGNTWDATDQTAWNINHGASGFWSNNVYTAANAGNWQVIATTAGLSDTATLTIDHGQTASIAINPKTASINAGDKQVYSATASDNQDNVWDVTAFSTWLTSQAAGGSWMQNVYTSQNSGNWQITGQSDSKVDTAQLTVYYQIDFNHDGKIDFLDTIYFCDAFSSYNQNHNYNAACDFNNDGKIDFTDLVTFASLYISYCQTH